VLPERYVAAPLVTLDSGIEIDVGNFENLQAEEDNGGIMTFAHPRRRLR
jgi:hypothetical protein